MSDSRVSSTMDADPRISNNAHLYVPRDVLEARAVAAAHRAANPRQLLWYEALLCDPLFWACVWGVYAYQHWFK